MSSRFRVIVIALLLAAFMVSGASAAELNAYTIMPEKYASQVFEAFTAATVIYIIVNLVVVNLLRWLEKSVAVPGFIGPAAVGGGGH